MEGLYKEQLRLKSCDLDVSGKWRLSAIFTEMQEIAASHSGILGCGREKLIEHGMVWILSRIHLEMREYPGLFDEVVVETWHGKVVPPFFPRYFRFTRPDGTLLGVAATAWLLFDFHKRELLLPRFFPFELIPNENLVAPLPLPKRMRLSGTGEEKETRRVRYTDLDFNEHMNNTKYIEWICDMLGLSLLCDREIASLQISFDQEARAEDSIALFMSEEGENFELYGKNVLTDKTIFSSKLTLK